MENNVSYKEINEYINQILDDPKFKNEIDQFNNSYKALKSDFINKLSKDWKFNTFHWAMSVFNLNEKIIFSYLRMKALSVAYKNIVLTGSMSSHTNPEITFFADSTIVNLLSLRDKTALMVWSYFHPFNPEKQNEVLDFKTVFNRLKNPDHYMFNISGQQEFLKILTTMHNGNSMFKSIEDYRHFKIHRLEPIIHMYGVQSHNTNLPYIRFDKTNIDSSSDLSKEPIKGLHWDYDNVETVIENCLFKVINSCTKLFKLLNNSHPYNS